MQQSPYLFRERLLSDAYRRQPSLETEFPRLGVGARIGEDTVREEVEPVVEARGCGATTTQTEPPCHAESHQQKGPKWNHL
jgi:hypothetical protein